MKITITQMAIYQQCAWNTAKKRYQCYLDILDVKRRHLTIYDLSNIDGITESQVLERLGLRFKNHQ